MMDAAKLLGAVASFYATLPQYRDRGSVVRRFFGELAFTDTIRFRTAFSRPDRFRFEFKYRHRENHPWCTNIIWEDGGVLRTRFEAIGTSRPKSLRASLAMATGMSNGAAQAVPALLMGDQVGGSKPTDLVDVSLLSDVTVDGACCYRLRGNVRHRNDPLDPALKDAAKSVGTPERFPRTLWIDADTLMLRRIEWRTGFGSFGTETIVDYQPTLGRSGIDEALSWLLPS